MGGEPGTGGDGFDEHYVRLFGRARWAAQQIVRDRAEAEDIAAETMARALVRWSRIRSYAQPWVTRVATNLALDRARRRQPVAAADNPVGHDDQTVDRLTLAAALRGLARRQREVVAMRYLVGLQEPEIAEALGIRPGTVKTHLRRGLEQLRLDPAILQEAP